MNLLTQIMSFVDTALTALHTKLAGSQSAAAGQTTTSTTRLGDIIRDHLSQVFFWTILCGTTLVLVLLISITRKLEAWLDPLLFRIKRFAPYIMQATLGVALMLSAYHNAFLGPDLMLAELFGSYTYVLQTMMYLGGAMLLLGLFPRMVSFAVILVTLPLAVEYSTHLLTHAIYVGEAITIFIFGAAYHTASFAKTQLSGLTKEIRLHLHKYKFAILRVFFAISLFASAVYSRLLNAPEALQIAANSQLVAYFPDASFLLLTIVALEVVLGLCFLLGFELRFASLGYLAFLVFTVVFFQEAIWVHAILAGTPLAMFTHGYDTYTIGSRWFSQGNLEPIL